MLNRNPIRLAVCGLVLATLPLLAQTSEGKKLEVLQGPATAKLGAIAQVAVPAGFVFIDGKTLREYLKAVGEPVSDNLLGSLDPTNGDWSVMFSFHDIGYVKDDDKDKLDANKLLQQFKDGTEVANKIRERSKIPPIHVVGWEQPPRYNDITHNLEWAIRGTCEGREILNYDTRLLGRKGVMQVKLIVEPDRFASTLPAFTNLIAGYKFQSGNNYAEYRPGDKVAKYGLAALVAGGAAVGAAKLGLFAWLLPFLKKAWWLVVAVLVAAANFFKKIFHRLTGRDEEIRRED